MDFIEHLTLSIINLPHRKDRKAATAQQLVKLYNEHWPTQLKIQWVEAEAWQPDVLHPGIDKSLFYSLPGQQWPQDVYIARSISTKYSHMMAMLRGSMLRYPYHWIMEDDVQFTQPNTQEKINNAMEWLDRYKKSWLFLYLGGNYQGEAENLEGPVSRVFKPASAMSIIFSRRAYATLLERAGKCAEIDMLYMEMAKEFGQSYCTNVPLVEVNPDQNIMVSDIKVGTRTYLTWQEKI